MNWLTRNTVTRSDMLDPLKFKLMRITCILKKHYQEQAKTQFNLKYVQDFLNDMTSTEK